MKRNIITAILLLSTCLSTLFAQAKPLPTKMFAQIQEEKESSDFLGSCVVGFISGAVGAAGLLIKDATCGVLLPVRTEYWGRDRVLPLAGMILITTFVA